VIIYGHLLTVCESTSGRSIIHWPSQLFKPTSPRHVSLYMCHTAHYQTCDPRYVMSHSFFVKLCEHKQF